MKQTIQSDNVSAILIRLSSCLSTTAIDNNKTTMPSEEELKKLSHRIDELIAACSALKSENTLLKAEQAAYIDEKSRWASYQQEAKARVKTMLERIKSVEQNGQQT